jgi:hypothetical protein
VQDLGGWQDEHAEKDLEEIQRGSGQVAPAYRCPLEQELLARRPQRHGKGKAPVRFEAAHIDDRLAASPHSSCRAQDAARLAGVLAQCPGLAHLNLRDNGIGPDGAERLAGVLPLCTALTHLNLRDNGIDAGGAESLAGGLAQWLRWLTSISTAMSFEQAGQRVLQEC